MPDNGIQAFKPTSEALSAEHYQTYEMAKANDDVIGGEDLAQLRSYSAATRAQAQAVYKTIAMMNSFADVAAAKAETVESSQVWAKASIYADERMGELLRELPTRAGKRTDITSSDAQEEVTKADALQDAGISKSQAYDLEKLAANPDVVQAVLDKAEADGTIPSRSQVLKAIEEQQQAEHDRKIAEMERDNANDALAEAYRTSELMEAQIASLQKQVSERPKPEVVEREVAPSDYEATKRKVESLRHDNDVYIDTNRKLRKQLEDARKELDRAKDVLGMDKTLQDVRKDVQYLVAATNNYVRRYGGLTWTAASFSQVDKDTLKDLRTAATNLATFASALVASLEELDD